MERISSKKSFDSTLSCEELNTGGNLTNALLISTDETFLSKAGDEIFYNAYEPYSPSRNIGIEKDWQFSDIFEHTDSTNLISLSDTRTNLNKNEYVDDSMQHSNNLLYQQDTNVEKKNHETNKYVPLRVLLRRMFDEILGKYTKPIKDSSTTDFTKNSINECSLNNNKLLITKLDNTHEIHNTDSLCHVQKLNNTVVTSIKDINDSSKSNGLSSHDVSVSFLDKFLPKKLVTILENSIEDTSNSDIYSSFDLTERYIGRLPKLPPENITGKWCISKKIFNTSDINDSETSISSTISSEIEIVNTEIFRKRNSLQSNYLNFNSQSSMKKIGNANNVNNEDYNAFSKKQLKFYEN
ncbi:hypothetical protein ANTPLA_LOCUS6921 [Anthophora plagiata]